jgi:hypothetical protein
MVPLTQERMRSASLARGVDEEEEEEEGSVHTPRSGRLSSGRAQHAEMLPPATIPRASSSRLSLPAQASSVKRSRPRNAGSLGPDSQRLARWAHCTYSLRRLMTCQGRARDGSGPHRTLS